MNASSTSEPHTREVGDVRTAATRLELPGMRRPMVSRLALQAAAPAWLAVASTPSVMVGAGALAAAALRSLAVPRRGGAPGVPVRRAAIAA